jgi:predicted transcriptional regulator
MRQLVNLARGHALLTGRNCVTIDDLPMVIKVVLSTAPIERVTMFDILLANNGVLNVNQITQSLDVSEHTARKTMLELKILGLVNMEKIPVPCSDGITRLAFQIRLKDEFNWFLDEEFKTLREAFEPESSNDGDDGDGDDDNDDDNDSAPDPNAASATAITKGRPKTDWNNLLENKAVEEKIPPEKGENNNENNHKNMPLSGGGNFFCRLFYRRFF